MMKPLTAMVCAATLLGCSSSTVIRSNPPGAKVFIDGSYVGVTPYEMSDTKIVGSSTTVRLEYPGMAPVNTSIKRSEEFDVVACIGGVFLLVPFLWIMGYKSDHTYDIAAQGGGYPQEATPSQRKIEFHAAAAGNDRAMQMCQVREADHGIDHLRVLRNRMQLNHPSLLETDF